MMLVSIMAGSVHWHRCAGSSRLNNIRHKSTPCSAPAIGPSNERSSVTAMHVAHVPVEDSILSRALLTIVLFVQLLQRARCQLLC